VFQSRVLGGGIAFTLVMSGFVIWILQWVALSGWLLSYLGFAGLFLGLGATLGNQMFLDWAVWFAGDGIVIVSIINAFVAMIILTSGFKNYVRLQRVMWIAILVAFGTMLVVLAGATTASIAGSLNAFSSSIGGSATFYEDAIAATIAAGVDTNPPFSLLATLLIAPIAWTSLQWATYSTQQNGEIKDARSFQSQAFIIVGALVVTGLLLALLAFVLERAIGTEFLYVAGAGYWSLVAEATFNGVYLWPNIIAIAVAASPIVVLLISFGFIMNGHQIVHNCYIGMTRVMVAMSLDRLLPEWVSRVSERFHTPVNAHLAYFLASIPVIILYNNFVWGSGDEATTWGSLTLGRDVRLRVRVRGDGPVRGPAALPCQGALRGVPWVQVHDRRLPGRHRRWPARVRHGLHLPVPVRDERGTGADQRSRLPRRGRRAGRVRCLVCRHEDGPALRRHQRGLRVQGDPTGVTLRAP
jgi:amino acid transporter